MGSDCVWLRAAGGQCSPWRWKGPPQVFMDVLFHLRSGTAPTSIGVAYAGGAERLDG